MWLFFRWTTREGNQAQSRVKIVTLRRKVSLSAHTPTFKHMQLKLHAMKECPCEADFPHGRLALPVTGWHTSLFSMEGEKMRVKRVWTIKIDISHAARANNLTLLTDSCGGQNLQNMLYCCLAFLNKIKHKVWLPVQRWRAQMSWKSAIGLAPKLTWRSQSDQMFN